MIATHTGLTEKLFSFKAIDPPVEEIKPSKDRAYFADPEKKSLLSAVTKLKHLTPYIGTELQGPQLSQLNDKQKDELALLVAEVTIEHPSTREKSLMTVIIMLLREALYSSGIRTSLWKVNTSLRSITVS